MSSTKVQVPLTDESEEDDVFDYEVGDDDDEYSDEEDHKATSSSLLHVTNSNPFAPMQAYKQLLGSDVETIRAFLENKSKNKYFYITVKMGEKKGKLRVRMGREINSFDFEDAIELTLEQQTYISFTGMENKRTGEVFPMIEHPVIPGTTLLEKKYVSKMKDGEEYFLLTRDIRDDAANLLTREQLESIREKFNKIDENRTGFISHDEIRKYFAKHRDQKISSYIEFANEKIRKEPKKEDYHQQQLQKRINMAKKQYQKNVDYFLSIDINGDGSISFEEFRNNEVKSYITQNK